MGHDESPPKRSGRGATELKALTKRLASRDKTPVNIDVHSGAPLGLM